MGSNILESLARAYFKTKGMEKFGPNWVEEQQRAQIANQQAGANLAITESPEEARTRRAATIESTRALAGYRGAQAEGVMGRLEDADLDRNLRAAIAAVQQDPSSPLNQARLAAAKAATARAGWDAARTADPGKFSSAGRPNYQPLVRPTGEISGFYNTRDPNQTMGVPAGFPEGARRTPIAAGEMEKRGLLQTVISDADYLDTLVPSAAGSIGPWVGRWTDIKRKWIGGVEPEVNDLFHITDNLADMLLRARSGAQINEQEYRRLRILVPDPRTPLDTFADNLRRFRVEAANVLSARQGQGVSQVPPPSVMPRGGATAAPGAPTTPATSPTADPLEGRTATGPDGQKLIRRNGQWVPL